jgi:hypothetical protein
VLDAEGHQTGDRARCHFGCKVKSRNPGPELHREITCEDLTITDVSRQRLLVPMSARIRRVRKTALPFANQKKDEASFSGSKSNRRCQLVLPLETIHSAHNIWACQAPSGFGKEQLDKEKPRFAPRAAPTYRKPRVILA